MWNNAVSYMHTGLQTALHPLAAMAHEYPTTTWGIALLFTLLVAMLSAEIIDGRAYCRKDQRDTADPTEAVTRTCAYSPRNAVTSQRA